MVLFADILAIWTLFFFIDRLHRLLWVEVRGGDGHGVLASCEGTSLLYRVAIYDNFLLFGKVVLVRLEVQNLLFI